MDRNNTFLRAICEQVGVALLAEGVDRNLRDRYFPTNDARSPSSRRAWIEIDLVCSPDVADTSPSSRRAWIEILSYGEIESLTVGSPSSRRAWIEIFVYLHAQALVFWSPSSRRAWIEIGLAWATRSADFVALLAEGVDRNVHCCKRGL